MDTFMEYMIKQKKKPSDVIKSLLVILAATVLSLLIMPLFFAFVELISFLPLCVAAIFYGAYRIICRFSVEFEYILTNGELDVDKIMHRKKRKRLLTIHTRSFIEFGKVTGKKNSNKNGEFTKIIDASANSPIYQDYYAVFFKNGQKMKLIFNPTKKMIEEFKVHAPQNVIFEIEEL